MGRRIVLGILSVCMLVTHINAHRARYTKRAMPHMASEHGPRVANRSHGDSQNVSNTDIVTFLSQSGGFDTLLWALRTSGLLGEDDSTENFVRNLYEHYTGTDNVSKAITFFAPHDRAFEDMPSYLRMQLFRNPDMLRDVLLYHIVAGKHTYRDLKSGVLETLYNEHITLEHQRNGDIVIDGHARMMQSDIMLRGGVIHTIDKVLLP